MTRKHRSQHTLRQRVLSVFLGCAAAVLAACSFLLVYTYRHLIVPRVNTAYTENANQFGLAFSGLISSLNHVSQQLAYNDTISDYFSQYLTAKNSYLRIEALEQFKRNANLAAFSNPSIGIYSYANAETGEIYLANAMSGRSIREPSADKLLFSYSGSSYYGAISSQSGFSNRSVLSVVRPMDVAGIPVLLYLETAFRELDVLLDAYAGDGSAFLLLDNTGTVVLSMRTDDFPRGTTISPEDLSQGPAKVAESFLFPFRANQGWYAVKVVKSGDYNRQLISLVRGYAVTVFLLLVFLSLLFVFLWKRIYRPLSLYDRVIDTMLSEDDEAIQAIQESAGETSIAEYDRLVSKTIDMRRQLQETIAEVRRQEQLNSRMRLARLRSQINPHFLMNTLNTVHWMAVMKGEEEIDDFVMALNRLLAYNLKQGATMATVGEELTAVEQYIKLQQARYNIHYRLQLDPPDAPRDLPFPRFILQPLVENSLYHGYRENMSITLTMKIDDRITVTAADDGVGMEEESLSLLRRHLSGEETEEAAPSRGMGIGIRYVSKVLHMTYLNDLSFDVQSRPGAGTVITFSVPKEVTGRDGSLDS